MDAGAPVSAEIKLLEISVFETENPLIVFPLSLSGTQKKIRFAFEIHSIL